MGRQIILFLFLALFILPWTGQSENNQPIEAADTDPQQLLRAFWGSTDPARVCQMQRRLPISQLKSLMYGSDRALQLLAIDACECLEDPWPVMSHMAALMGARQRQVAARASLGLLNGLSRFGVADLWDMEIISARLKQLAGQLTSLADDSRLDLDVRVTALIALSILLDWEPALDFSPLKYLDDEQSPVRGAAMSLISLPAERETLIRLANIAANDPDLILRGRAAALLCENALSYNVGHLSQDLIDVLRSVLGNGESPAESIAPILACLVRFPEDARAELVELANSHPDSSISAFWKGLAKF